jgi:septal ring-binding cell division protein DamX
VARRSSRSGSGKAWLVLLTLLLLAAAGGTGWWWFYARQAPHRGPDATAHATPTPLPPPSLAPQVVEQVATPESTLAPVASPTALVAVPATPALATPALATPTARAAAPPTPPTGEPRTLLSAGRFADAARAYAARAQAVRSRFTVQILVACSDETIQKALQSVPSEELYIIPVILKGRSCYRLCWGSYASAPLAEDAQRRLPEYFRQGGALPRVVPVAAILP